MHAIDSVIITSIHNKMKQEGLTSLYDEELLAAVIKNGDKVKDVLTLSKNLLRRYHTLGELRDIPIVQLMRENKGLSEKSAYDLKISLELGKRACSNKRDHVCISEPEDLVALVHHEMQSYKQECFKSALLDTKNGLISIEDISIGIINASLVHAREVFRAAIAKNAYKIILLHNHPSGDPYPSQSDIKITEGLKKAGEIIGIKVVDHIIIGWDKYYSFQEENDTVLI